MPRNKPAGRKPSSPESKSILTSIRNSADEIRRKIMARKKPTMKFPVRSLANVKYHPQRGFFEIAGP